MHLWNALVSEAEFEVEEPKGTLCATAKVCFNERRTCYCESIYEQMSVALMSVEIYCQPLPSRSVLARFPFSFTAQLLQFCFVLQLHCSNRSIVVHFRCYGLDNARDVVIGLKAQRLPRVNSCAEGSDI